MKALIRKMDVDDIEAVQQVATESWHDTYEGIIPRDIQDRFLQSVYSGGMLKSRMKRSYMFVAEVNGEVVGFANFSFVDQSKRSLLNAIYIYPHFQGKGIGTTLLEAGIAQLENVKSIYLHVEKGNEAGINFYKAKNFEIVAEINEEFVGHSLKTVQMVLKL